MPYAAHKVVIEGVSDASGLARLHALADGFANAIAL